jgi:hypothetical protein
VREILASRATEGTWPDPATDDLPWPNLLLVSRGGAPDEKAEIVLTLCQGEVKKFGHG